MFCPNCGSRIPDDAAFCPECGAKIEPIEDEEGSLNESGKFPYPDEDSPYEEQETQLLSSESGRPDEGDENITDQDDAYAPSVGNAPYEWDNNRSGEEERSNYSGDDEDDYPDIHPYGRDDDEKTSKAPVAALIIIAAAAVVAVFFVLNQPNLHLIPGRTSSAASTIASGTEKTASKAENTKAGHATVTPIPKTEQKNKKDAKVTVTPTPTAKPSETPTPELTTTPTPAPTTAPSTSGDYIFPDSDTVALKESDLAGLNAWQLTIARNEIVARHGWVFNRTDLQDYFNQKSWYHPVAQFTLEDVLNPTEYNNMLLIQKYQDTHGLQTH